MRENIIFAQVYEFFIQEKKHALGTDLNRRAKSFYLVDIRSSQTTHRNTEKRKKIQKKVQKKKYRRKQKTKQTHRKPYPKPEEELEGIPRGE